MAPAVEAYQAMRCASFLVAVTFAAEIGDVRRFDTPRQLMSFLGVVPAESSTGDTIRRKGLTLAGNRHARQALVEAAWWRAPRHPNPPGNAISGVPGRIVLNVRVYCSGPRITCPRIAPASASASPDETAVDPTVCRSVCGVTPGSPAFLIALAHNLFVP